MKLSDFGFTDGINEIIAITFGERINTAPIGIILEDENSKFAKARLYPSHTRRNIEAGSRLWANVIYDPIVWTITAFDDLDEGWFESLDPPIIRGSLAWCEFDAKLEGEFARLELLRGGIVRSGVRTVNRGFNALIEALVHATRYKISRDEELWRKIVECKAIVEKCGGRRVREAFEILMKEIR